MNIIYLILHFPLRLWLSWNLSRPPWNRLCHIFGKKLPLPELRQRLFLRKQQENESLTDYAVAMQNLWRLLEKRDVWGCADITTSEHILLDQFIIGLKAGLVRRALQKKLRCNTPFPCMMQWWNAIAQDQEKTHATVAVTQKSEAAYLKEEALAPSSLSAM